ALTVIITILTFSSETPAMNSTPRRILFIDSYDSFTHNLTVQLSTLTSAEIYILHNDSLSASALRPFLSSFDAVVVGPGPGSPDHPADVGVIPSLWDLEEEELVPVLGVCLGHQSLCLKYGGTLRRMKEVRHGIVSPVEHSG